ncbi:lysostaphin resistance A-like protein [Planctomycetota bacterium]
MLTRNLELIDVMDEPWWLEEKLTLMTDKAAWQEEALKIHEDVIVSESFYPPFVAAFRDGLDDESPEALKRHLRGVDSSDVPLSFLGSLAVLQAELDRTGEARRTVALIDALSDTQAHILAAAIRQAYGFPGTVEETTQYLIDEGMALHILCEGWSKERLARRLAERAGDAQNAARVAEEQKQRGQSLLLRSRVFLVLQLGVVVVGLALVLVWLLKRRPALTIGEAPVPGGFTPGLCWAVIVRGMTIAGALVLTLHLVGGPLLDLVIEFGSAVLLLPFALVAWYLVLRPTARLRASTPGAGSVDPTAQPRRRRWSIITGFGLAIPRERRRLMGGFTLVMVSVGWIGSWAIVIAATSMGAEMPWHESIIEELLWGSTGTVLLTSADAVIAAPLFEEILFRGIIYASIRSRLAPLPAALTSAALFSVLHLYSPIGFVMVMWSGVLWALVYEKCRSLWPGIFAHAADNLLVCCMHLFLYRF